MRIALSSVGVPIAGLLTHPNIVAIYDAGVSDGQGYIALELVNGKSLQALIDSSERFSVPRLIKIMEQVCSALEYAQHQNVVHRDIKPANIMLTADDLVKITDFGTAKIMQYGSVKESSVMGTPGYISPEQIKGSFIDGRTDIFALGVTLYELTTSQRPFAGNDIPSILYKVLNYDPPSPHTLDPSIPLGVSSTIMKALSKSPYLRYETCTDLLEDLKNYRPDRSASSPRAASTATRLATPPPVTESGEKFFGAQMPRVSGVVTTGDTFLKVTPKAPLCTASTFSNDSSEKPTEHIPGVYSGPSSKFSLDAIKRYARIGAGILAALWLVQFALNTLGRKSRLDSDTALTPQQVHSPTTPTSDSPDSALVPRYVSASNPQVAILADLPRPWSSRSFIFYNSVQSRNVLAQLIRLTGPASQSTSYWAFSLEAPFSNCELEYIQELTKISSDYGVPANHPMVVNPYSHTVFDPLQFQKTPGDTIVRGAVVKGSDLRPPYVIEVKVFSNRILTTAME